MLGVYPAASRHRTVVVDGEPMMLPAEVERASFDGSKSGHDIDESYLAPLGLTREDVLFVDLMPYFLANVRGKKGETMWDNIQRFERSAGVQLGIEPRPAPAELVQRARSMPGNLERLRHYIGAAERRLVLTLGVEAAAFARGESFAETDRRAHETFYADPVRGLGDIDLAVDVVHLSHPGNLMGTRAGSAHWRERHVLWCSGAGRRLAQSARSS